MVVQSKGSINLFVYSCYATSTPKFYAAVVKYMALRESPKLMTFAFTMSLGLKHSIITTESIIFYLTFYLRIAPSNGFPCLDTQGTELTCRIYTIHSSYFTLRTFV